MKRMIEREPPEAVFYTRDVLLAYFLSKFSRRFAERFFFEIHSLGKFPPFVYRTVFRTAAGIISTNSAKKKFIVYRYGIDEKKILVMPNGFDADLFSVRVAKLEARRILGLEPNLPVVMYWGSLQPWKGAGIIPALARLLPHVLFITVGGREGKTTGNLRMIEQQPYAKAPLFLRAADILIAPYQDNDDRSLFYFSPLKLIEYMASGTPIIATDLPSIREVVDRNSALLVPSVEESAFKGAIEYALHHKDEMEKKATLALEKSAEYSWNERARRIIEFMKH